MGGYTRSSRATVRIQHTDDQVREDRADAAYWNILGFAKTQPDAVDWAKDIVSALGLDQPARRPPGQLGDPRDTAATRVQTYAKIALTASRTRRKAEPKPVTAHGTRKGYQAGCGCPDCIEAAADYGREYRKRLTARKNAR